MNPSDIERDWLTAVLARDLHPVAAPGELWDRVQFPRSLEGSSPRRTFRLALAAALAAVLLAAFFISPRSPGMNDEALAVRLLARGRLAFHCGQAVEIRSWIKANTGLDVPIPAQPGEPVRLLGASALTGPAPAAEIAYQLRGHAAVLLISKPQPLAQAPGSHGSANGVWRKGAKTLSWTLRGQNYTMACAEPADLREACLLCHLGSELPAVLD